MTPRERAVTALENRIPDVVPHFELEMQLTEEYFGKRYTSREEWAREPERAAEFLRRDAELLIATADRFDYCIIFYSGVHRPTWEDYLEGVRVLRELDGGRRLLMAHGDSTMSIPDGEHMLDATFALFDRPEEIKSVQDRLADEHLARGEKLRAAGLDGFILCSDYCFNSGPFLSPGMFAEFVAPYLARLIREYRRMGAYTIKHTDGNIMPILDQLVSAGPHGLHSLDPMAGVDLAEVKRLYGGKICLIGNVNCALLQTGTEEEILASCRYAMEHGKPGGGYIFSTSNVIFRGVPRRSYDLMLEFYQKHRAY
ncbi:MAG: uroporphyrinogen decarboxylase family protein [Bacteroidota bacterium]